jgi:hypothetical protein
MYILALLQPSIREGNVSFGVVAISMVLLLVSKSYYHLSVLFASEVGQEFENKTIFGKELDYRPSFYSVYSCDER